MTPNTPPPAVPGDIEESELQAMLQTVIDARCGLSAIHQLLDGAQTMADIRARFSQWQASQRVAKLQQMDAISNVSINGTQVPTLHHD